MSSYQINIYPPLLSPLIVLIREYPEALNIRFLPEHKPTRIFGIVRRSGWPDLNGLLTSVVGDPLNPFLLQVLRINHSSAMTANSQHSYPTMTLLFAVGLRFVEYRKSLYLHHTHLQPCTQITLMAGRPPRFLEPFQAIGACFQSAKYALVAVPFLAGLGVLQLFMRLGAWNYPHA